MGANPPLLLLVENQQRSFGELLDRARLCAVGGRDDLEEPTIRRVGEATSKCSL
jgi:hypothetical protein